MFSAKSILPVLAGLAVIVGCDSKPVDKCPTVAPAAMKEPHEVLRNLQYMAVRKDLKHAAQILVTDPNVAYGSAWWFNKHAGELGLSATDEEIKGLGATEVKEMGYLAAGVSSKELKDAEIKVQLKQLPALPANMVGLNADKLDALPQGANDKDMAAIKAKDLNQVLAVGLYRLAKGVPVDMWNDLVVIESKKDKGDATITQVYLGLQGESLVQVAVKEKADKTLGICYMRFMVWPKKLQGMYDKLHPSKAKK